MDIDPVHVDETLATTRAVRRRLDLERPVTEIVMLPVAWSKGTDFRRAPRHPARSITYFDRFGVTEPRSFGWRTADTDNPGATWRFDLEQIPGGTRLRYHHVMGPGPSGTSTAIEANADKHVRIVRRRLDEGKANMQRTVDGIKQLAEDTVSSHDRAKTNPQEQRP